MRDSEGYAIILNKAKLFSLVFLGVFSQDPKTKKYSWKGKPKQITDFSEVKSRVMEEKLKEIFGRKKATLSKDPLGFMGECIIYRKVLFSIEENIFAQNLNFFSNGGKHTQGDVLGLPGFKIENQCWFPTLLTLNLSRSDLLGEFSNILFSIEESREECFLQQMKFKILGTLEKVEPPLNDKSYCLNRVMPNKNSGNQKNAEPLTPYEQVLSECIENLRSDMGHPALQMLVQIRDVVIPKMIRERTRAEASNVRGFFARDPALSRYMGDKFDTKPGFQNQNP